MGAGTLQTARRRAVECGNDLSWGVFDDMEALRVLRASWEELLRPGQVFLAPSWVLTWLEWRKDEVRPAVLVAHDGAGRLRGLLPLARTGDDTLVACGAEQGAVGLDVVALHGDTGPVARGAVEVLARLRFRDIHLRGLLAGGALHGALRASPPGWLTERVSTYCPYVVTTAHWEEYLAGLGKHLRHELRRKLRRTLATPDTCVRWIERQDEVEAAVRTLFDLHARRFRATGKETAFAGEALRAFHVALARDLAERGALILGLLEHDGAPVAAVYGFRCKGGSGLFQTGFDPASELRGAGEALRIVLQRDHANDDAQSEIDFLDGCYPWKLRLASGVRRQFEVCIRPRTAAGFFKHGLRALGDGLRRSGAALLRGPCCPGRCGTEINPAHCHRAGCPDADVYNKGAA